MMKGSVIALVTLSVFFFITAGEAYSVGPQSEVRAASGKGKRDASLLFELRRSIRSEPAKPPKTDNITVGNSTDGSNNNHTTQVPLLKPIKIEHNTTNCTIVIPGGNTTHVPGPSEGNSTVNGTNPTNCTIVILGCNTTHVPGPSEGNGTSNGITTYPLNQTVSIVPPSKDTPGASMLNETTAVRFKKSKISKRESIESLSEALAQVKEALLKTAVIQAVERKRREVRAAAGKASKSKLHLTKK